MTEISIGLLILEEIKGIRGEMQQEMKSLSEKLEQYFLIFNRLRKLQSDFRKEDEEINPLNTMLAYNKTVDKANPTVNTETEEQNKLVPRHNSSPFMQASLVKGQEKIFPKGDLSCRFNKTEENTNNNALSYNAVEAADQSQLGVASMNCLNHLQGLLRSNFDRETRHDDENVISNLPEAIAGAVVIKTENMEDLNLRENDGTTNHGLGINNDDARDQDREINLDGRSDNFGSNDLNSRKDNDSRTNKHVRGRRNKKLTMIARSFDQNKVTKEVKKVHSRKKTKPTKKSYTKEILYCLHCDKEFTPKQHQKEKKSATSCNINMKINPTVGTLRYKETLGKYKWNVCKYFTNKVPTYEPTVHMQSHTDEKPFECMVCNKSFSTKGNLKVHERIHTGEKPFRCTVCFKAFSIKCNMLSHMGTHETVNIQHPQPR